MPQPVYATTNSFGYYRFNNLPVGQTYVETVRSKRFKQGEISRVVALVDELTNLDFVIDAK